MNCKVCNDKQVVDYWLSVDEWRSLPCNVCNAHIHNWVVDEFYGHWLRCSGCDTLRFEDSEEMRINA